MKNLLFIQVYYLEESISLMALLHFNQKHLKIKHVDYFKNDKFINQSFLYFIS